ncbi:MAG: hypothetical protein JW797_11465 [Bradymonadales bacterium]|nr:hypothetical protein [Bradymonadales bacterium]
MRRFGVSGSSQERRPTYYEELVPQIRPRVRELLSRSPQLDPLGLVALEICSPSRSGEATESDHPPSEPDEEQGKVLKTYLTLLCDNDILPPSCQLTREEVGLTWRLLKSFTRSDEATPKHFDSVLGLLEEKFQSGKYSQANLLLRLFETTEARRRNNERTLFYEQMITRFGAHRTEPLPKSLHKRFRQKLANLHEPAVLILAAAEWLHANVNVNLDIPLRDTEEYLAWQEVLKLSTQSTDHHETLDILAPARLRDVTEIADTDLPGRLQKLVNTDTLHQYVAQLLRCCYFVVLVTGKTGFEPFIKSFLHWVEHNLDYPGTRLLPELHRRTTVGDEGLELAITDIVKTHLGKPIEALRQRLDYSCIDAAIAALAQELEKLPLNMLAPGEYDLFGLVLDRATRIEIEDPSILLRIHRIC